MAGREGRGTGTRLGDGWLPPATEAAAYEGLRRGDEAAFRAVAEPLQPTLRRLAALATTSPVEIDALTARTWEVALGGLDMFHWQTPFATWVAGLAVAVVRGHADGSPGTAVLLPEPQAVEAAAGPEDWSDLPWGSRWGRSWEALDAVVAAMPLPVREAVQTREVERWPPRRVCDVLGLTEHRYHRLLAYGRTRLRDGLAGLVAAAPGTAAVRDAQADAVVRMLRETAEDRDGPLDAGTLEIFRRWRATRRWHWRLLHPRSLTGTSR